MKWQIRVDSYWGLFRIHPSILLEFRIPPLISMHAQPWLY
jgi:hypothetical protein